MRVPNCKWKNILKLLKSLIRQFVDSLSKKAMRINCKANRNNYPYQFYKNN